MIRPGNATLELRPVTVLRDGERSVSIGGGLKDGERIMTAGVHTVYAGEPVRVVKPLFDGDGEASGAAQ